MEHTSEIVADGKLLHESSYPQRAEKYREIDLSVTLNNKIDLFGKIDFYDAKDKVIHEIKRSDKIEEAHEWQVKYYILLLEENDVAGVKRILENPKLRETKEVLLEESYKLYLEAVKHQIIEIVISEN